MALPGWAIFLEFVLFEVASCSVVGGNPCAPYYILHGASSVEGACVRLIVELSGSRVRAGTRAGDLGIWLAHPKLECSSVRWRVGGFMMHPSPSPTGMSASESLSVLPVLAMGFP